MPTRPPDFKVSGARLERIIASGSNKNPQIIILGLGAANSDGINVDTDNIILTGTGSDTWMFVSGSTSGTSDLITLGGSTVVSGSIFLVEGSAPTTSAGKGSIYVKSSDSLLYFKSDAGTEYNLTAGGGGGSPGGADKEIQFRSGSAFSGSLNFSFVYASSSLQHGLNTVALGLYSHAAGEGTIASGSAQTVVGKYNKRGNVDSLFVVGSGTGDLDANRNDVLRVNTDAVQVTGSLLVTANITGSNLLVNSNALIQGDLTVNGTTTTINTTNLLVKDPLILFGSGSVATNSNGGIALASGSADVNKSLVWGRVANDTWGAGKLDVTNGTITDLTGMSLVAVRASKYDIGGSNAALTSSDGQNATLYSGGSSFIRITPGSLGLKLGNYLGPTEISGSTVSIGSASLSLPGTDTFFFASGSIGGKGTTGVAVFGGDVVISGSLTQGDLTLALGSFSHAEGVNSVAGARFVFIGSNITNGVITVDASYGNITTGYTSLPSNIFINDQEYGSHYGTATAVSFDGTNSYITSSLGTLSLLSDSTLLYDISNLTVSGTLSGAGSHSEGLVARTAGNYSHAEGHQSFSYGEWSHAEGYSNSAIGNYSHAEGFGTYARGVASHTDGEFTIAVGQASHAGGYYTIASGSRQTVVGKYNQRNNSNSLFVVGDGSGDTDAARHDILRVNSGSVEVTGSFSATLGLSGSLTRLTDGKSYLVQGSNITITSASNGQITISSTGGGGGGDSFFSSTTAGSIFTTGSAAFRGGESSVDSPSDKGTDVFFYVSGSISGSGVNNKVSRFGGDVVVSGSFTQGLFNTTSGLSAHAQGNNTTASGSYSHAEGGGSLATGDYSHAEGTATTTSGIGSHAEGSTTTASGDYSHAEGYGTDALGDYSHAEGYETVASSTGDHAEGYQTTASGGYSHAEGYQTIAAASYSHAEGEFTTAAAYYSHAEGGNTVASGSYSHAEGYYSIASGSYSHAEGGYTIASGSYTHAEGINTQTNADFSHAEGSATQTGARNVPINSISNGIVRINSSLGNVTSFFTALPSTVYVNDGNNGTYRGNATAVSFDGVNTFITASDLGTKSLTATPVLYDVTNITTFGGTSGDAAHAEGYGTKAAGSGAHTEGDTTYAFGTYAHTEGKDSVAGGNYSHAEGLSTFAGGRGAHAEGSGSIASGAASHAEGGRTNAVGYGSHAEGFITTASNFYSHAEGNGTLASGFASHAEGVHTTSSNNYSHAEGQGTQATGIISHAEGFFTVAAGEGAHSAGTRTLASGNYTRTAGLFTTASDLIAHAEGNRTLASGQATHTEGGFTTASFTYAHAEGSGSVASGRASHAEGEFTLAFGISSHAQGFNAVSYGDYSFAGGIFTIASGSGQTVFGKYNKRDNVDSLLVVGNGTADSDINRSDVLRVETNGIQVTGSFGIKGDITPDANTTYNLGTPDKRWANVYTGDLHLRNDRGDWTIVEEEDYLCVVNNKSGKRYKMMLQPID